MIEPFKIETEAPLWVIQMRDSDLRIGLLAEHGEPLLAECGEPPLRAGFWVWDSDSRAWRRAHDSEVLAWLRWCERIESPPGATP